jgi:uncharacterized RDD family membrane protein YckC
MSTIGNLEDIVLLLCILAVLIVTVRMCAKDAIRRGKSPWLVTLMIIVFFPFGLLVWLAFRPKVVKPAGRPEKFKLDDFRVQ